MLHQLQKRFEDRTCTLAILGLGCSCLRQVADCVMDRRNAGQFVAPTEVFPAKA